MQSVAVAFHALADSTRRSILVRLKAGPSSVNDLVKRFHMSQPAVSQHLRVLRDAGMVRVESRGRQRLYRLEAAALQPAFDWVAQYERFWNRKLAELGEFLGRTRR